MDYNALKGFCHQNFKIVCASFGCHMRLSEVLEQYREAVKVEICDTCLSSRFL
jgi:hypothetical protein